MEFDSDWIVRDFEEIDEKLPQISKEIVLQGLDFRVFEKTPKDFCEIEDDEDLETVNEILFILQENLECFSELTAEELESLVEKTIIGCELVVLCNEGLLEESEPGSFVLTKKGSEEVEGNFGK